MADEEISFWAFSILDFEFVSTVRCPAEDFVLRIYLLYFRCPSSVIPVLSPVPVEAGSVLSGKYSIAISF